MGTMHSKLPCVSPETGVQEIGKLLVDTKSNIVLVGSDTEELVGVGCITVLKVLLTQIEGATVGRR